MFFVRFIPTFPVLHRSTFVFKDCIQPLLLNAMAIGSLYLGPKASIAKVKITCPPPTESCADFHSRGKLYGALHTWRSRRRYVQWIILVDFSSDAKTVGKSDHSSGEIRSMCRYSAGSNSTSGSDLWCFVKSK